MKKKKLTETKSLHVENRNVKTHEPESEPQSNISTHQPAKTEGNAAAGRPYFEVAESVRNNSGDRDGYVLTDAQKRLLEVQGVAIDLLFRAHNSMIELAAVRLECKLSNTRVSGVAKELKELIKVMSVYDC